MTNNKKGEKVFTALFGITIGILINNCSRIRFVLGITHVQQYV